MTNSPHHAFGERFQRFRNLQKSRLPLPGKFSAVATDRSETLAQAIEEWQASPEWAAYSDGTKRVYSTGLRALSKHWGAVPLMLFDDPRMRSKILGYRDANRHHPAGTDNQLSTLNSLLNFAVTRRKLLTNAAASIPDLYRCGHRALICWSEGDLDRFVRKSVELDVPHVGDAALLMSESGLRPQDLITVTRKQVQECAIVKKALKKCRGRRRFAVIPKTPTLDHVLETLESRYRASKVDTLLVNHEGQPWFMPALDHLVRRIRRECGLIDKRLYDLRGTFATRLVTQTDLTNEEIAQIMGWSTDSVRRIRRAYVDHDTAMEFAGERLARAPRTSN